jgi:hypothetical protein
MRIEVDDVSRPQVLALLDEHLRNMHEITPPDQVFAFEAPARTLYRSAGFRECGPFGSYKDNGFSIFMALRLGL